MVVQRENSVGEHGVGEVLAIAGAEIATDSREHVVRVTIELFVRQTVEVFLDVIVQQLVIDIEHLEHRAPQLIVRLLLLELLRQRAYEGRVAHMIHLGNAADQRAIEADDERVHRRDECDIAAAWEMTATKGDSERGTVHLGGIAFGQLRYFITHTGPAGAGSGAVSLRPRSGVDSECHR